jgi:hypothetical protein
MEKGQDFIPGADGAFRIFAAAFKTGTVQHAQALGIPAQVVSDLTALVTAFDTAYQAATAVGHNSDDVDAKKDARTLLERKIRHVKKAFIDPVEDMPAGTRNDFGLPPKDDVRTEIGRPETRPDFSLRNSNTREIFVELWDEATGKKLIPYGFSGAVAVWKVGGPPPASAAELTNSRLFTSHRGVLTFEESERGQTLYIALAWQNEKGEKGEWSEIKTAIIS